MQVCLSTLQAQRSDKLLWVGKWVGGTR